MNKILHWFHRSSASKLISYIGLGVSTAATVCIATGDTILHLWPIIGAKLCALAAIGGATVAALGRGIGDRRPPAPPRDPAASPGPVDTSGG